jgi:hypothetical protein
MNSKQLKTLKAVFEMPTRSDIRWRDIEILFSALGGHVREGNGSRVRVYLKDSFANFHRLHPSRMARNMLWKEHDGCSKRKGSSHDEVQGLLRQSTI